VKSGTNEYVLLTIDNLDGSKTDIKVDCESLSINVMVFARALSVSFLIPTFSTEGTSGWCAMVAVVAAIDVV
jgi:hypothetical protein